MKCPVCNGESFFEWCTAGEYSIRRCQGCRLGITDPFPSEEEIEKANTVEYRVGRRIDVYLSRQEYFERRYRKQIATVKKVNGCGRLLDIGCNIGLFLKVAKEAGFDSVGVERNRECAEYGRKKFQLRIHSDDLENLRFPSGSFDTVTLFDTLEHVSNILPFLAETRRILKDGGLLVVQSPNLDSLMAALTKSHWAWLGPPDHLYHFTPGALSRLVDTIGFRILKVETWEPLRDFCVDLFPGFRPENPAGKLLLKSTRGLLYAILGITHVNRLWWMAKKGGLILLFARKAGASPRG